LFAGPQGEGDQRSSGAGRADRQTSVDFREGVLGMPLGARAADVGQPNQNHLYLGPGAGCRVTIARGAYNIADAHLTDANERLSRKKPAR
jgi:catechol 2,3-dioxygenase-like lactoylglutathione lyase family enzyme